MTGATYFEMLSEGTPWNELQSLSE